MLLKDKLEIMFYIFLLSLVAFAEVAELKDPVEEYSETLTKVFQDELAKAYAKPLSSPADYPAHYTCKENEEFDFIVAGGGLAGCIVANRLSENWRVLLLEAGDDPKSFMDVPALHFNYLYSEVDWNYKNEVNELSGQGFKDKSCPIHGGKMLGGSNPLSTNYFYPLLAQDYDTWEAEGAAGWAYKDVLPYELKTEDLRNKEILKEAPEYHGSGGYQKLETWYTYGNFSNTFGSGMEELGYAIRLDANGKNRSGFNIPLGQLENGRRYHSAKAYLSPIKDRENLMVSKNSLVNKVLIDRTTKQAYGVQFTNGEGKTINVKASKEVILSAGAIGSPHILMLSGIGPKDHLSEFDIEVLSDVPVGKGLRDLPILTGVCITLNYTDPVVSPSENSGVSSSTLPSCEPMGNVICNVTSGLTMDANQSVLVTEVRNFLTNKGSILTNSLPLDHVGLITTDNNPDYPNGFFLASRFPQHSYLDLEIVFKSFLKYEDYIYDQVKELTSQSFIVIPFIGHTRPKSTGTVKLVSTDIKKYPKINLGLFSEKEDFKNMLSFYDFLEKLVNTEALRKMGAKLHEYKIPACDKFEMGSRDYRICSLKHLSFSIQQMTGSCKMGAKNATDTVVDPKLRVKGIKRLRVVDYSIKRSPNAGNGFAMAEKGADLIKKDWL